MGERAGLNYGLRPGIGFPTSAATQEFLRNSKQEETRRRWNVLGDIRSIGELMYLIGRPVLLGCLQALILWYILR